MPRASEFAVLYSQLGEAEQVMADNPSSALATGVSVASHLRKAVRYKAMAHALFVLANNDLRSKHAA